MRKKILLVYIFGICVFATFALLSQTMKLPDVIEDNEEIFEKKPTESFLVQSVQEEFLDSDYIEIIDVILAEDMAEGLAGMVVYEEKGNEEKGWSVGFVDEYGIVEEVFVEGFNAYTIEDLEYTGGGVLEIDVVENISGNKGIVTMTYVKGDFHADIAVELHSVK